MLPHLIWLNCIVNRQGHIWPIIQSMHTLFSTWGHGIESLFKLKIFKELMMTCWCQHVHNKEILDQYKNWEVNDLHFEEWCHNILWLVTKWKPIRRGRLGAVQSVKRRAQRASCRDPVERECQKSAKSSCQKLFTHRRMRPSHLKSRIESRGVIHHKVDITRDSLTQRGRVFQ